MISPVANWVGKGNPFQLLDVQYRMNPEISQWPNEFFYKGLIKNHHSTTLDNPIRQARRDISILHKCIGADGRGSCFRVMDVPLGVSRIEEGGTSLVNYANADYVKEEVRMALERGVPPSDISVLSWYGGQKSLLLRELRLIPGPDGELILRPYREISTVDAFQGKENSYVIVDLVFADPATGKSNLVDLYNEHLERAVFGQTPGVIHGQPTAHVKNGPRLNVGLTRARHVLVIICQSANLMRTSRMVRNVERAPLAAMIQDAIRRKLVVTLEHYNDTSPQGRAEREAAGTMQTEALERETRATKYHYVEQAMQNRSQPRAPKQQPKAPQAPDMTRLPPPKSAQDKAIAREEKKRAKAHAKERKRAQLAAADAKALGQKGYVQPMPKATDEDVEMGEKPVEEGSSAVDPTPSATSNVDVEMGGNTAGKARVDWAEDME